MQTLRYIAILALVLVTVAALAAVQGQGGPYRVTLETQPAVIPIGSARIFLTITDAAGEPLEGLNVRGIAEMPGMFMGEREQRATPVPGRPGTYSMPAAFPMAGLYHVRATISGPPGEAEVIIEVSTGQDTSTAADGIGFTTLVLILLGLCVAAFVIYRVRKTGQTVNWSALLNPVTIIGLALLAIVIAASIFAVNNLRRPGAMTPLEAQGMEMHTPAPPGVAAVRLAVVERGPLAETVRYSGQAVGYVDVEVFPRVTGAIVWMPFYAGDRVSRGQVIARLDTSQIDPQVAESEAGVAMAQSGLDVAQSELQQALEDVNQARAGTIVAQGALAEARANVDAAMQERFAAESELASMRAMVPDAEAQVAAARAERDYKAEELRRTRTLFERGAVSQEELQRSESEAQVAESRLRQAQAGLNQAEARVRTAEANVRRAAAQVTAAGRRVQQAEAELSGANVRVRASEAGVEAARRRVEQARAGVAQARAGQRGAETLRQYTEIRSEVDGVVTERRISPGVVVNPGQAILRLAQISPIRLQANVPVEDLERVRVGSMVTVSNRDGSDPVEVRVTSISPAVDPRARTGIVEALYHNRDNRFLPGQFVTLHMETGRREETLHVPMQAIVRSAGIERTTRTFVWVADPIAEELGSYMVDRVEVQVGVSDGTRVEIISGLSEGQMVVTAGHANLRPASTVTAADPLTDEITGTVVEITTRGYDPDTVEAVAGEPLTITFIRRTEQTCGTEVIFPDLGIEEPLPLNQPVTITITPERTGDLRFTCGMDMLIGRVVVR